MILTRLPLDAAKMAVRDPRLTYVVQLRETDEVALARFDPEADAWVALSFSHGKPVHLSDFEIRGWSLAVGNLAAGPSEDDEAPADVPQAYSYEAIKGFSRRALLGTASDLIEATGSQMKAAAALRMSESTLCRALPRGPRSKGRAK